MINTGPEIAWTMDWCPDDEDMDSAESFLAVGCHPRGHQTHEVTKTSGGSNAIQIWRFPDACIHGSVGKGGKKSPTLAMKLWHDGGPTWSLCWCPASQGVRTRERMGLLAGVLGDGRICIWSIPSTDVGGTASTREKIKTYQPVAYVGKGHVDGSIPCTVDWLPHAPYDLLLVGYRDGCVSIIKMFDRLEKNMEVIQYFPAEVLSLTSAKWFPKQADGCSVHGIERHMFVTSGHESGIHIWDSRFEYSPRVSVRSNTAFTIQDMCWTTRPLGIVVAMEDGTIREYLMDAGAIRNQIQSGKPTSLITFRGTLPGGMWSVDSSVSSILTNDTSQTIAYGGEDGVIGIVGNPNYPYVARKRKGKDIPLVGLWSEGDGMFRLLDNKELMAWQNQGGLYQGGSEDRKKILKETQGPLTDVSQTIYTVRWSRRRPTTTKKTHGQWLAYGNAHGLIHCLWIPSQ